MSAAPADLFILADPLSPPGRWAEDLDGKTSHWVGAVSWGTRHGSATVNWLLGKMHGVWGAVTPSGEILDYCEISAPFGQTSWRYLNADGRSYTHGSIEVRKSHVIFTELADKSRYHPGTRFDSLEAILAQDPAFVEMLKTDDQFAHAVNDYLSDRIFRRDQATEGRWQLTRRQIAGMIANMRELGETYIDYYPYGGTFEPRHTLAFEEVLERIGWHLLLPEEYATDHQKALDILALVEARDAQFVPVDDRPKVFNLIALKTNNRRRDPIQRMHNAAGYGRATQSEFSAFFDLFDYENERAGAVMPSRQVNA